MSESKRNPWLGLQSYTEGKIIYGRDDDIRDLLQCILNNKDTLLHGKSGIGKSSLLNAGIFPVARRHGYLPVIIRLSHKDAEPYLQQVKNAIARAMCPEILEHLDVKEDAEVRERLKLELAKRITEVVPCKNPEKESFYEYFHRHTFHGPDGERLKFLIVFDQFEEIFTLQDKEIQKKNFFAGLADFLNGIMPENLRKRPEIVDGEEGDETGLQSEVDFESFFDRIDLKVESDTVEYINDNVIHLVFTIREDFLSDFEYYSASIPSLKQNRYGLRPINEEQAAQIIMNPEPGLIEKSVAKLIIQRITERDDFDLDGVPEIEVDAAVLSLYLSRLYEAKTSDTITSELVNQKGDEIISDFYKEAISAEGVSEKTVEYLESVLLNGQDRRDIITVFDAKKDGGVTDRELDILCNEKKILRQFHFSGILRLEYVHDVLCRVVKEHKEERELLKKQEEERRRLAEEQQKLLMEAERKRKEVERKAAEEKARLEAETLRIKQRNRRRLTGIGAALFLAVLSVFVWWLLWQKAYSRHYGNFTTLGGWPVGLGKELKSSEIKDFPIHYRLTRKGYFGRENRDLFERVDVVNSLNAPVENLFYGFPVVDFNEEFGGDDNARSFIRLLRKMQHMEYYADGDAKDVTRMMAYDRNDKLLFSVQYYNVNVPKDSVGLQWGVFIDDQSKPLQVRDNGMDRILLKKLNGYEVEILFYTSTGVPVSNRDGITYGYKYDLAKDGRVLVADALNVFGEVLADSLEIQYDYDSWGRCVMCDSVSRSYERMRYIERDGKDTSITKFDGGGKRCEFSSFDDCSKANYWFDAEGDCYKYEAFLRDTLVELYEVTKNGDIIIETNSWKDEGRTSNYPYLMKKVIRKRDTTSIEYWGGYDIGSTTIPMFPVESRAFDKNGNLIYRQRKDSLGVLELSEKYVYDDFGVLTMQWVSGIDGDPIRCPALEHWKYSYYKMRFVANFSEDKVAIRGENEFGDECYISYLDQPIAFFQEPAFGEKRFKNGHTEYITTTQITKQIQYKISDPKSVCYIHNISKDGCVYQAGIKDGDLLIKIDGIWEYELGDNDLPLHAWDNLTDGKVHQLTVLRPNTRTDSYDKLNFEVRGGILGSEIYKVYFTDAEVKRLNRNLN